MFTASQQETPSKMAKVICEHAKNIPNITPCAFEVGLNEVSCDSLTFVDFSQCTYIHVYLYDTQKITRVYNINIIINS